MRIIIGTLLLGFWTFQANSAPSRLNKQWISAKQATTADEFRTLRRVGIATGIGGVNGVAGLNLDLNFTDQTTFGLGYGLGSPFKAFSMYVRRYFGTQTFSPYFAGGYARWFQEGTREAITSTTPNLLGDRFLTEEQKKTGKFQKNFLYPAIGIQYNQLTGDWAGLAFSLELDFLIEVENLVTGTTAGIGCAYYF